jgi:putative flippase GtrA
VGLWHRVPIFHYKAYAKPLSNEGLKASLKSDTLAIIAFEIGLFAWMALMYFVFFPHPHLKPTEATYWFMTQIGMVLGFLTSYPMNRWLIKVGWKPVMG